MKLSQIRILIFHIFEKILAIKLTARFLIILCFKILVIKWTIITFIKFGYLDFEQLLANFVLTNPEILKYLNLTYNLVDTTLQITELKPETSDIKTATETQVEWYNKTLFTVSNIEFTWKGIAVLTVVAPATIYIGYKFITWLWSSDTPSNSRPGHPGGSNSGSSGKNIIDGTSNHKRLRPSSRQLSIERQKLGSNSALLEEIKNAKEVKLEDNSPTAEYKEIPVDAIVTKDGKVIQISPDFDALHEEALNINATRDATSPIQSISTANKAKGSISSLNNVD